MSRPDRGHPSERLPADERRERLIQAFIDEALACGSVARVGVRGVVERAGCSAPVLYRLFGDRDGLIREAVRSTHMPMIERIEAVSKLPDVSTADRLRTLARRTTSSSQGAYESFEALVWSECRRDPAIAQLVRDVFARFEELIVEMLLDGVARGELRPEIDPAYVAWRAIDLGLLRSQLWLMTLARPAQLDYLSRAMESLLAEIEVPDRTSTRTGGPEGGDPAR